MLYSPFTKVAEKYNIKHINSIAQLAYLFKMTFNAFLTICDECFEFLVLLNFYCYYCIFSTIIDIFILDGTTKKIEKVENTFISRFEVLFSVMYGFLEASCKNISFV